MREHPIRGSYHQMAREALSLSPLFRSLTPNDREIVLTHATLHEYAPHEIIISEGEIADSFYLLIQGEASVSFKISAMENPIELSRVEAPDILGEMALLLGIRRSATVSALGQCFALRFHHAAFELMLDGIKGFGRQLSILLAERLAQTSRRVPLPEIERDKLGQIDAQTIRRLPPPFILRHRVLPLQFQNNLLTLGCVDDPTPTLFQAIQRMLPGTQIRPFRISYDTFSLALNTHGLQDRPTSGELNLPQEPPVIVGVLPSQDELPLPQTHLDIQTQLAKIKPLLQRAVAEGASDLYLSAQEKPRWRIGNTLFTIEDYRPFRPLEAFHLLSGFIPQPRQMEFEKNHHIEFSCTLPALGRFRINLFRGEKGINAVLRYIPLIPPAPEQLQFPVGLMNLLKFRDGLVLFSGSPGSGKTTTMAALLYAINQTRRVHVLTLEDPIEYVHESHQALIHQREVGSHANSMPEALQAAMREAPDILMVGELNDPESLSLAMEAARSGCLVLASTQTKGAARTLLRFLEQFPSDKQFFARRALSEVLRAVVSQELCRKLQGGRIAAFELLYMDPQSSNLLRQDQLSELIAKLTEQPNNLSIHVHLAQLVHNGIITPEEAFLHAFDRKALEHLLKATPPPRPVPPGPPVPSAPPVPPVPVR